MRIIQINKKMIYTKYKKWTNASKTLLNGKKYDSKFEASYSLYLDQEIKKGNLKNYETHQKIELIVNNYRICNYYIDFIAYWENGITEYIETKGYQTVIWKMKWRLFEALYSDIPEIKITLVQQGNSSYPKIRKV